MDEKPEGTPNPLNPNPLDANPSESMKEVNEVSVTEVRKQPTSESVSVQAVETVESLDPSGRPMEKVVETAAPKKRKKTGLIIGFVVCLFIAVGCGVAAILMLMNGDKDPVAAAMKKLMSGEGPTNVVVDGSIEFNTNDNSLPISKMIVDLKSQTKAGSMINASSADVTLVLADNNEVTFGFEEVYATTGELYFKIDGVADLLEKINIIQLLSGQPTVNNVDCATNGADDVNCLVQTTDCETDGTCEITDYLIEDIDAIASQDEGFSEVINLLLGAVKVIDGEWLKVSVDELGMLSNGMTVDSNMSCMINMVDSINTNSNSAAELYNKNPFLGSTTENVTIDSKLNPVRELTIDDEALADFVNSIQNSEMTKELYDCLGWENNVTVTAGDVAAAISQFPAIYVEVDKDDNFSRLYMVTQAEDATGTITIDLSFSYPTKINVSEPVEYMTFEDVVQKVMMSIYNLEGATE